MKVFIENLIVLTSFIYFVIATPEHPEINDQYETLKNETDINIITEPINITKTEEENKIIDDDNKPANSTRKTELIETEISFITKIKNILTIPIIKFVSAPKVSSVLRNIGTCIVNGAMEIISYYFPAPIIPLIASAAGMVIPFEPVVMLKERMPVTTYRRAFHTAMKSFLGTFDKYKDVVDDDNDPYMTRRFNRRFMNDKSI